MVEFYISPLVTIAIFLAGVSVVSYFTYKLFQGLEKRGNKAVALLMIWLVLVAAVIKSGVDATLWTIDPTSKAGRVTQYETDGQLINKEYAGCYRTPIEIVPTTLTLGTTYFTMRNLGTRRAWIVRLELKTGFSGTAAATRSLYEIERFSAATPTGGTALTAIKNDNTFSASSLTDIRFAPAGLTTTGVTFEQRWHMTGNTNQLNVDMGQDFTPAADERQKFQLAVNEGLAIRANTAIVAGSYLIGSIQWCERT